MGSPDVNGLAYLPCLHLGKANMCKSQAVREDRLDKLTKGGDVRVCYPAYHMSHAFNESHF